MVLVGFFRGLQGAACFMGGPGLCFFDHEWCCCFWLFGFVLGVMSCGFIALLSVSFVLCGFFLVVLITLYFFMVLLLYFLVVSWFQGYFRVLGDLLFLFLCILALWFVFWFDLFFFCCGLLGFIRLIWVVLFLIFCFFYCFSALSGVMCGLVKLLSFRLI